MILLLDDFFLIVFIAAQIHDAVAVSDFTISRISVWQRNTHKLFKRIEFSQISDIASGGGWR